MTISGRDHGADRTALPVRSVVFVVVAALLLALIMTKTLGSIIPPSVAGRVGHNSEAIATGLLVIGFLQVLAPRIRGRRGSWWVVGAVSVASAVVAGVLLTADLPPTVATLNESFVAFAVLAPYLWLTRPLRWAPVASLVLVIGIVVWFDTDAVFRQAESLVLLALAPIAFDVADPTIADRSARDRPAVRAVWCALLVGAWVVLSLLAPSARDDLDGVVSRGIDYVYRGAEGLLSLLLLHVYFSYWLGHRWRRAAGTRTPVS